MRRLAIAMLLVASAAQAQEPHVELQLTPIWAARAALADAQALPADVATRTRYVWLRGGTRDELAALSFVLNSTLSRVNIGVVPGSSPGAVPFAGGHLVRLDLGVLATDLDDFANLVSTWELLAKRDADFTAKLVERKKVIVPEFRHTDGKLYRARWETVSVEGPAAHVAAEIQGLTALTQSLVPVIDGRELQATALTTLQDGIYYNLRGMKIGMDLGDYLQSRGASEDQVKRLESMEKAVVLQSKVTGKERMVAVFRGAGVLPSRGGGIVSLTFDGLDEDRAADDSPVRNLLNFDGQAIESLVEVSNGFIEGGLWQNRKLVAAAPPNVASDHKIPEPHTRNLEPLLGCIRCHGPSDSWQGFNNDAQTILAAGIDIFGDLSSPEERLKQVQLLAGLYSGDWFEVGTGPLSVARLSHNRACLLATGSPIKDVSALISTTYDAYIYQTLDTWAVAKEIGLVGIPPSDGNPETKQDQAAAVAALRAFIGAQPQDGIVVREDAVIAAICAGLPVTRNTFNSAKHIIYERAYQRMGRQ